MAALRRKKLGWYAYFRDEEGHLRTLSLHTRDEATARIAHEKLMHELSLAKTAYNLVKKHSRIFPDAEAQAILAAHPMPPKHPAHPRRLRLDDMIEVAQKHRELSKDHLLAFDRFRSAMKPLQYADEITPAAALAYLDDTLSGGNGKTYNTHLTMLNVIFRACLIRAGMPASPFAAIPRRAVKQVEHFRPLSIAEFRAIFAAAAEPWKTAALISWHTALRRETCFRLAWKHIDPADRSITISPGKTARFGRAVYIPIHPELWEHLQTLPRPASDDTPILSQWPRHTRYGDNLTTDYFNGLLAALNIRDTAEGCAGFHSLRVSFVTRCDEAGIARRATRGVAGHVNDNMTDLYSHDRETAKQILTLPGVLK